MRYEFILKIKTHPNSLWEQRGKVVVHEEFFDYQKKRYEQIIYLTKRIHPGTDCLLLINKLNDKGDFLEVVQ